MSGWEDRLDEAKAATGAGADKVAAARKSLGVRPIRELIAEVDASPPPGWLARGVWPADSYGVLGAIYKGGKTWVVLDLSVSVASAGCWLDRWSCTRPGPVLLFCGEGGKRKLVRRLRAVCEHKAVLLDDLDIHVSERVPHLRMTDYVAALRQEVESLQPVFVAIDPAYLAVRGTQTSSLVDVGEALVEAQHVCQDVGAALLVSHHFNQTGGGTGVERFSGAGWAEWGRVLVAMTAETSTSPLGRSMAMVTLELRGDEIADQSYKYLREVWADDPEDLDSPMHYVLRQPDPMLKAEWATQDEDAQSDMRAMVLAAVEAKPGINLSALRSAAGHRGIHVDQAVADLKFAGQVRVEVGGQGKPTRHWPVNGTTP